jgi:hypothetical protein
MHTQLAPHIGRLACAFDGTLTRTWNADLVAMQVQCTCCDDKSGTFNAPRTLDLALWEAFLHLFESTTTRIDFTASLKRICVHVKSDDLNISSNTGKAVLSGVFSNMDGLRHASAEIALAFYKANPANRKTMVKSIQNTVTSRQTNHHVLVLELLIAMGWYGIQLLLKMV